MRDKRYLLGSLFLLVLAFSFTVSAEPVFEASNTVLVDCFLDDYDKTFSNYQIVGYVSSQGHFTLQNVAGVTDFLNALWCSKFLAPIRSDGEPTF